jgi:hypothetical protein
MPRLHTIGVAALALTLSACGGAAGSGSSASSVQDVPDTQSLILEVPGGTTEALTTSSAAALEQSAEAAPAAVPTTGDDLAAAREKVASVNAAIRSFVGQIEAVAATAGVPAPGSVTVYGPVDRCVVASPCDESGEASLKLTIRRAYGSTWAFVLEAAPVGTESFKPVAAGWMHRGQVIRRGSGRIALNLEALRAAAPAYTGQGYLLGGFSSGPVAKSLTYVLTGPAGSGFTPDPSRWPAANAAFRGFKTAAGVTRVRVAGLEDLYRDAASDTGDELGFASVVYEPSVGGRAYAIVKNYTLDGATYQGDVPTAGTNDHYFLGRACYGPGQTTPAFKEWFYCAHGVRPAVCIGEAGGVGTPDPGTAGTAWTESCPTLASEFDAPATEPTGASDTSPEQGEASADVTSEDPPVDVGDTEPPAP